MFRDTYKSAMDDIRPDSGLLGTILSRADEENAKNAKIVKSAKKTFSRKWVYSVGACAASFVLVICSVIGYNRYSDVNRLPAVVSDGARTNNAADENETAAGGEIAPAVQNVESDTAAVPSEKSTLPTAETAPKINNKKTVAAAERQTIKNSESKSGDGSARESTAQSGVTANDVTLPETSAEDKFDGTVSSFAAPVPETADGDGDTTAKKSVSADCGAAMSESAADSAAGGGGSMRAAAYSAMTKEEYAEYIGIDVSVYLPSGFSRGETTTVYVGADGSATQNFIHADGRAMNITLTKDAEGMEQFVKDSSLEKLTDKAVCDEYDDGCIAYGYGENIGYIISGNLTKSEVKRLAESISK